MEKQAKSLHTRTRFHVRISVARLWV